MFSIIWVIGLVMVIYEIWLGNNVEIKTKYRMRALTSIKESLSDDGKSEYDLIFITKMACIRFVYWKW